MLQISLLARRAATIYGDQLATSYMGRVRTWAQFADRVARLAGGLAALGVGDNDRFALLGLNSDRMLELFYGVPWAGGVLVPLNTRSSAAEIEYCISDSGARILFVETAFVELLPQIARDCFDHIVIIDGEGASSYDAMLEAAEPGADRNRHNQDLAGIFYTGGTTGRPKGVMLSHSNILSNVFNLIHNFTLSANSRVLHSTPMFHIAGAINIFAPTIVGAAHFFLPKFDPGRVLDEIENTRISYLGIVPTMLNMLADEPSVEQRDLSSLVELFYGGSPMPESAMAKALRIMPHVKFFQGYGLTETSPTLSLLRPEDHELNGQPSPKLISAGQPVANVVIKILGKNDEELPVGEIGEICVAGNTVMLGYWKNPTASQEALRGGLFHTGDLGRFDSEGFLYVVDRLKDMIITGGENVYCIEVENALLLHPAVLECAVLGIPSDKWGEQVHAVVRLRDGAAATDQAILIQHCRAHISAYKAPRSISFSAAPLPRSGANKLLKKSLGPYLPQAMT